MTMSGRGQEEHNKRNRLKNRWFICSKVYKPDPPCSNFSPFSPHPVSHHHHHRRRRHHHHHHHHHHHRHQSSSSRPVLFLFLLSPPSPCHYPISSSFLPPPAQCLPSFFISSCSSSFSSSLNILPSSLRIPLLIILLTAQDTHFPSSS